MKLIDNAGIVWHRLWSMRFSIATTIYTGAAGSWVLLPTDWKPDLSETAKAILAGVGMMLPVMASLSIVVKQPKLAEKITEKTGTTTITVPVPVSDNAEHA